MAVAMKYLPMTNAGLVNRLNDCVIHPSDTTSIEAMVKALDEYLAAIPGQINALPIFKSLSGRDQHVVVMVATAIIYHGYKPVELTAEEKDLFHPELHKWLDGVKHHREDYIIYLDFLEATIEHLSKDSRCCG